MSPVRFRLRWLAGSLAVAGCTLLNSGCAETAAERADEILPTVRLYRLPTTDAANGNDANARFGLVPVMPAKTPAAPAGPIFPVAFKPAQPELPTELPAPTAELPAPRPITKEEKLVPITLDTVLRLAEEQNIQVAIARERLSESETEQRIAAKSWLPKVYAGPSYYRHEGGIQDFQGNLIHSSTGALFAGMDLNSEIDVREATFQRVSAERKAWQQRGELSKVTSETLLEAGTTYLDLLTARRGEAVARELEKYLLEVKERAEKLVTADDQSAQVLVEAAQAEASGRRQNISKLHQQGDAASDKLAYLLGVGTCARMVPIEEILLPIDLVDPTPPANVLVEQALTTGPGVRELENMLSTMQAGLDRLSGPVRLLPVVKVTVAEGVFSVGPGGEMASDNRLDLCLQVRWNLMEFVTAREQRHLAESRVEQARLSRDDLRAKLTAAVQEARDASLSGREQIRHGTEQISHAISSYNLSDERLKMRAPNASAAEVLQAIRGLETAHYNYLTAVNAYNKAQIRLLVLLGPTATKCAK